MAIPHINYTGQSKVIRRLCETVNEIIDEGTGGGGGSDVSVDPLLSEGTPIADITVDGDTKRIFTPQVQGVTVDQHPLEEFSTIPDWAFYRRGYVRVGNSYFMVNIPLYLPVFFTDNDGFVCAAYDNGDGE